MGCGCASFGLHACTSVPITERKQLRLIPEAKLNAQAEQLYEKVKEKEKLSKDITTLNKIKNIGSKIENSITEYFARSNQPDPTLSLIHISEPTRRSYISYAVFCLKKFFFNDTATTEIYTWSSSAASDVYKRQFQCTPQ